MKGKDLNTQHLLEENQELKVQLMEAQAIIDAIREGEVDALVVNANGHANLYSLESADYTYRLLIEKFGEGALSISDKGNVLYCNQYFANLINLPAHKIVGSFFNSYVDSVGQFKELQDNLASGLSKGEIVLNVNGVKIPVYVSLTDLRPTLPAIGIIVTDLSEKRRTEEALELYQRKLENKVAELNETNNDLEQFIHVISHDIKEPIRKIVTYASDLIEVPNEPIESKKDNLKIIKNSALRLNSLVDDLVKYSMTTTKNIEQEIDLNEVLTDVVDDLEIIINERSAKINFRDLPKIQGSLVQMRQLFSNLISNSLKYRKVKVKPIITITATVASSVDTNFPKKVFNKLSVEDNGIGMNEENIKKIFTIFQRLHTPEQYSGNGIGLAICKRIMENHMGRIEVESKLNEGSTFHLYFPVKAN